MNTAKSPEIEGKILDINYDTITEKILELGGIEVFRGELRAQWLININGEKVRVRQEGDRVFVEHKEPIESESSGIKSFDETGFEAYNFGDVIDTLSKLGLKKHGLLSVKHRVSFLLESTDNGNTKFDIDTYIDLQGETIPMLLEIEASTQEQVTRTAELLGYNISDLRNYGPVELLRHYYPNKNII